MMLLILSACILAMQVTSMESNPHGYYDFSEWYPDNSVTAGSHGSNTYGHEASHYDQAYGYHASENYAEYGNPYYTDDTGILSETFAAISGLGAEFAEPYMTPATYEEPSSSPEAYLVPEKLPADKEEAQTEVDASGDGEEESSDSSLSEKDFPVPAPNKPVPRPASAQPPAPAQRPASSRQQSIAEMSEQSAMPRPPMQRGGRERGRGRARGRGRNDGTAAPTSVKSTPTKGYGWPNPDWWTTSTGERDDFNRALAVYLEHAKTNHDPNIAFVCIGNAKVVQDLLSNDPHLVQRAAKHIDRGVSMPGMSGQLFKIVGVEMGWRIYHTIAQRLNWTLDKTMHIIGTNLNSRMAKALASGDANQFESELSKIAVLGQTEPSPEIDGSSSLGPKKRVSGGRGRA